MQKTSSVFKILVIALIPTLIACESRSTGVKVVIDTAKPIETFVSMKSTRKLICEYISYQREGYFNIQEFVPYIRINNDQEIQKLTDADSVYAGEPLYCDVKLKFNRNAVIQRLSYGFFDVGSSEWLSDKVDHSRINYIYHKGDLAEITCKVDLYADGSIYEMSFLGITVPPGGKVE